MKATLDAQKHPPPDGAMFGLEVVLRTSSKRETALIELIKMRVSQINGCAFCLPPASCVPG